MRSRFKMRSYSKKEQDTTDGLLNATMASEWENNSPSLGLYFRYSGGSSPQYLYSSTLKSRGKGK